MLVNSFFETLFLFLLHADDMFFSERVSFVSFLFFHRFVFVNLIDEFFSPFETPMRDCLFLTGGNTQMHSILLEIIGSVQRQNQEYLVNLKISVIHFRFVRILLHHGEHNNWCM